MGYEGLYKVSNLGRIRSVRRSGAKGGLLNPEITRQGYLRIQLYKNNKVKRELLHRLVATSFVPNPENKPQVNHKDGVKNNNSASNLEWVTPSENQIHAFKMGLQKVNVKNAHRVRHEKTKVKINQFDLDGNFIKTFDSIKEAAFSIGMKDGTHISAVARGKRNQCGGYKWKYLS